MPTLNPRITFTVTEETMKAIDEYRFSHRLRNQTQAILSLIDLGFKVLDGDKPVVDLTEKLTDEDRHVLNAYHAAEPVYQGIALEILESHQAEKKKNRA
jgi:hypothetical protein